MGFTDQPAGRPDESDMWAVQPYLGSGGGDVTLRYPDGGVYTVLQQQGWSALRCTGPSSAPSRDVLAACVWRAEQTGACTVQGSVRNSLRHGHGSLTTPAGFSYVGDFRNDLAEGFGQATYPEGHSYVGEWRDGQRSGFGELVTTGGDTYAGEWAQDVVHGHGRWTFTDGSYFEGHYEAGNRVHGTLSSANGADVYTGQFKGSQRHGQGLQVVERAWQYKGEWRKDKRHGQGECRYFPSPDAGVDAGGQYQGAWKEDVRCGWGSMRWPSGEKYDGNWHDDARHGAGTCTTAQGDVYSGDWVHGQRQGQGRCVFANGDKYDGQWLAGHPQGQGTMMYASGEVYKGSWESGRRHGQGSAVFADGTKFTGAWQDDSWVQGGADHRQCRISGAGISRAIAGQAAHFTIEARDERGNRRLAGGDVFCVAIVPWRQPAPGHWAPEAGAATAAAALAAQGEAVYRSGPSVAAGAPASLGKHGEPQGAGLLVTASPAAEQHPKPVDAEVQDLGDGKYDVRFCLQVSGLYELRVELIDADGGPHRAVADSPYQLRVLAADPFLKQTRVSGPGCSSAVCGEAAEFRVQLRDSFSNPCSGDKALHQLQVKAQLVGGSGGEVTEVSVEAVSNQGAYVCRYKGPAAPGYYRLEVTVAQPQGSEPSAQAGAAGCGAARRGDRHLPGSPYSVMVTAGATQAPASARPAIADESKQWELRAKAMYAADGDDAGWDSGEEDGGKEGKQQAAVAPGEREYIVAHPEVPVVQRLEDLWKLGRLQAMQRGQAR